MERMALRIAVTVTAALLALGIAASPVGAAEPAKQGCFGETVSGHAEGSRGGFGRFVAYKNTNAAGSGLWIGAREWGRVG